MARIRWLMDIVHWCFDDLKQSKDREYLRRINVLVQPDGWPYLKYIYLFKFLQMIRLLFLYLVPLNEAEKVLMFDIISMFELPSSLNLHLMIIHVMEMYFFKLIFKFNRTMKSVFVDVVVGMKNHHFIQEKYHNQYTCEFILRRTELCLLIIRPFAALFGKQSPRFFANELISKSN